MPDPLVIGYVHILQSFSHSFPQCPRSILCTRNADCRICISNLRVGRRSSGCFFLSITPWTMPHLCAVEYSPAYECGRDMLRLLWSLLPSSRTIAWLSSLCLLWSSRISLVDDISGQIQYGTCNSTSNVINYLCHSWHSSCVFCCGWRTSFIITQEVLFSLESKDFYSTASSGGFLC